MSFIFKKWLRALGKLEYVQGKNRPDVGCILCSIRDNDKRVKSLKYYQDELIFVTLNLFPYNPAHSMVVPKRHVLNFTDLKKEEIIRISRAIQGLQMMLNDLYNPHGYNIGLNQGINAGGSIKHLHFHVVPRYGAELGYIDIVSKTRIVVEGLESVKKKLETKVSNYLNKDFFMDF
ncbi:MAG: HIT domain-containing protein [Candidatus Lokiarchaeota archaeon]|nr:HIT domain-containing protein [Candidatus Lokiarchaeota archaeon]MBD3198505.1 HIT domain-containing protein [Candidatus Lokiarchaeota archaeon]